MCFLCIHDEKYPVIYPPIFVEWGVGCVRSIELIRMEAVRGLGEMKNMNIRLEVERLLKDNILSW